MTQNPESQYIDFALGKAAMEFCNHPLDMTKPGDDLPYDSVNGGYLGIHHPANITVDLEQLCPVRQVSIKFFDCEDELCKHSDTSFHEYAFRLLCSEDGVRWKVLYDSTASGHGAKRYVKGWLYGVFEQPESMRFFRIHALHNPSSSGFHVVRLRLLDREWPDLKRGDRIYFSSVKDIEVGDSTPLSTQLYNLLGRISSRLSAQTKQKASYQQLSNHIFEKALEFEAIDGRIDQIRKVVTPHIENKLTEDSRKEKRSTIIETCITVLLLILNLIFR